MGARHLERVVDVERDGILTFRWIDREQLEGVGLDLDSFRFGHEVRCHNDVVRAQLIADHGIGDHRWLGDQVSERRCANQDLTFERLACEDAVAFGEPA